MFSPGLNCYFVECSKTSKYWCCIYWGFQRKANFYFPAKQEALEEIAKTSNWPQSKRVFRIPFPDWIVVKVCQFARRGNNTFSTPWNFPPLRDWGVLRACFWWRFARRVCCQFPVSPFPLSTKEARLIIWSLQLLKKIVLSQMFLDPIHGWRSQSSI